MKKPWHKKNRFFSLAFILLLTAAFILGGIICNNSLQLTEYYIACEELPSAFQGFRVAQVSDLHNSTQGKNNKKLLNLLKESNPDIIVITGDMIDSRNTNVEIALNFAKKATEIAPCYYVTGNHEARIPADYELLQAGLQESGVQILSNESIRIERKEDYIVLTGADDPWFATNGNSPKDAEAMRTTLERIISKSKDEFTILLSHRPEHYEIYKDLKIDLTLSGHAHGGQIRLPFLGGLYAPNQGLLPAYDKGIYEADSSRMIVSSGVGNSLFPLRLFNPPEVVLVELTK